MKLTFEPCPFCRDGGVAAGHNYLAHECGDCDGKRVIPTLDGEPIPWGTELVMDDEGEHYPADHVSEWVNSFDGELSDGTTVWRTDLEDAS